MGSVLLHELYFGSLGGDGATRFTGSGPGTSMAEPVSAAVEREFGSVAAWRREFVALAGALSHGSGCAMLVYSRRDGRLYNQIAVDHSHAMIDGVPTAEGLPPLDSLQSPEIDLSDLDTLEETLQMIEEAGLT